MAEICKSTALPKSNDPFLGSRALDAFCGKGRTRTVRQTAVPDLYPLPEEFPAGAVSRLLGVVGGTERDPKVIAHAVWHLAGYALAVNWR